MKYKTTHVTTYRYSDTVASCHNQAHLIPREGPAQVCQSYRLLIQPAPALVVRRKDAFGNELSSFSIAEGHRQMVVTAVSQVEVRPRQLPAPADTPPWEQLADPRTYRSGQPVIEAFQFAFNSPSISTSPELEEYARVSFPPGRPILEAAMDLASRIHRDFVYDTEATHVHTSVHEAFELRRGVCQDFAHVAIGCLRSLGVPARYVSGYLRTIPPPGAPRLIGADASHAWLSVYCGAQGWVDLDPTNNVIPTTDHITLAWGREYADVAPIKGVFVGGGQHSLEVAVDVEPLTETN